MKTSFRILPTAAFLAAASLPLPAAQAPEPVVIERGPHHALHHWTTEQVWPDGQIKTEDHYVTELATGLNFFDGNQWMPSKEEIELFEGGAVARQGPFQVIFGPNVNAVGAVDLLTPAGQRFSSRILGLGYRDALSGASVLIAETRDSPGQVLPPNQVFYLDAFDGDGVEADVRYTFKKGSFEQDIILRSKPRPPSAYGLSDEFSRMEVWTEFFNAPAPLKQPVVLRAETDPVRRQEMAVPDFVDHRLSFNQVEIGTGTAFRVADDSEEALPVAKDWETIQEPGGPARTFLIESVEFSAMAPWLNTLPGGQAALRPANAALLARQPASTRAALIAQARPAPLRANDPAKTSPFKVEFNPQLAALNQKPGVVLDYVTLNSSKTNYIFQADRTYSITGAVNLYGASNVIEGGSVLKFSKNVGATINVKGTLLGDTDLYRPAILTASADSTVGESLGGTLSGYHATTALEFDYATSSQLATQQNLRILYAVVGVRFNGGSGHELRHLQLVNCGTAVKADNAQYAIRNALGWNLTNALVGSSSTGAWEHATFNGVTNLVTSITGRFTNCLLTAVVATNGLTGESNIVLSSANGVFKSVGSGFHYLTNGSPYRDLGTTNINPTLAGELRKRTTYAPIVLGAITADTTLTPQAGRDTDLPDVGWHYSPLDYFASGVTVSSNVTLTLNNGVAVGVDYASSSWGFDLRNARFISTGKAEQFNYVGRAHTAQEKSGGNPGARACFYDGASSSGSRECALRLRFTEFTQLQNDGYMLYVGTKFGALEWTHSRVYNPSVVIDTSGNGVMVCGMTNTLWERGFVQVGTAGTTGTNVTVHLRNNLARKLGSWNFFKGSNSWTIRDNLFDSLTVLTNNGSVVQNWTNAYFNMFWGLTSGVGNTNLASLTYEVGPLGKYYLPTNSVLINKGTRTADLAQLFHFTTATNQLSKETNSIVDIGLHYVAVNGSGQPIDGDGDGTPDYLEDADNDGVVDSGETNWQDALDWGLRVFITRPRNGGNIP